MPTYWVEHSSTAPDQLPPMNPFHVPGCAVPPPLPSNDEVKCFTPIQRLDILPVHLCMNHNQSVIIIIIILSKTISFLLAILVTIGIHEFLMMWIIVIIRLVLCLFLETSRILQLVN
jgi:hypothetical protein